MTEGKMHIVYVLRSDLEQRISDARRKYDTAPDEEARRKAINSIEFWQELLDGAPNIPEGYVPRDQKPLQKELLFEAGQRHSATNICRGI